MVRQGDESCRAHRTRARVIAPGAPGRRYPGYCAEDCIEIRHQAGSARDLYRSTGDFEEALGALLGNDAGGLSALIIARLKEAWVDEGTVRHRTIRSRGCLSSKTALAMILKLAQAAEKSWSRLRVHNQLPKVILGMKFNDGIEVVRTAAAAGPRSSPNFDDSSTCLSKNHIRTVFVIKTDADNNPERWMTFSINALHRRWNLRYVRHCSSMRG